MNEQDIIRLIEHDHWMMEVITAAARVNLPQWMIGAGFVRNKVWDHLHDFHRDKVDTADIDLIYFDPADLREETEKAYDRRLQDLCRENWSTKNQARMHVISGACNYTSAEDGLSHWVESATCVAVTLGAGKLRLIAPYGVDDLTNLILRPTSVYKDNPGVFLKRVAQKQWLAKWPKLRVEKESARLWPK